MDDIESYLQKNGPSLSIDICSMDRKKVKD